MFFLHLCYILIYSVDVSSNLHFTLSELSCVTLQLTISHSVRLDLEPLCDS
jgi:hypothetical protein